MTERVIQGFFLGGVRQGPGSPAVQAALVQPKGAGQGARQMPGPPPPAFAPAARQVMQQHRAPGAAVQRPGGDGDFAVDPMRLGLSRGGGSPLPQILLAKMEAAFGADFSAVRVHVGPQPARIGALAFTTGNDLYFAPGQYQPDSVRGQQLIGHELAHVVQQRSGRVRGAGNGTWVVQNRALEAEADRLGARAAAHVVQPMRVPAVPSPRATGPAPSAALQMRRAQGRQPPVNRNPGDQRAMARQNNHNQRRLAARQLQQARQGGVRVRRLRGAAGRVARAMLAAAPQPRPQQVDAAQQAAAPQLPAPLPFAAAPRLLDPREVAAAARQREQVRQGELALQAELDQLLAMAVQADLDHQAVLEAEAELVRQAELARLGVEAEALSEASALLQQAETAFEQRAKAIIDATVELKRLKDYPTVHAFLLKYEKLLGEAQIAKMRRLSRKRQLQHLELAKGWYSFLAYLDSVPDLTEDHKHFAPVSPFGNGLNGGKAPTGHRDANFDAGEGRRWHIHFRDHVKFGNGPQIDFAGRTSAEILAKLNAAAAGPLGKGVNQASLNQCKAWIQKNLK